MSYFYYASAFRLRRHYVFGLSVRPSVRSLKYPSFHLYMGPLVHPTNRDRFTACPSVRPERFPGVSRRMHGRKGLKFGTLMYLGHLQNRLDYGHGLSVEILALFWLSEMGQIWGFRAFPRERMEGMAWNFACLCIVTTIRTDLFMVMVCWFLLILALFWLSETGQIWGFQGFPREAWRECPIILHAGVSWPSSELISLWSRPVDFSNFGAILT